MAGKEPFHIAGRDPLERLDEGWNVAAVMGVDRPHRAVAVDVVAREQQVAHAEGELTVGMPGGVPDLEFVAADLDDLAIDHLAIDLHDRHVEVDVLRGDLGEGLDAVARLQRLDRQRMGQRRCLEDGLRLGEALDVVNVGVRRHEGLALRQREVHLPDHLNDLVHAFFVADVDQPPVAVVVDQVNVAANPPAGLVVHLDDTGEDGTTFKHRRGWSV